jgi:hypothetical protein
LTISASLRRGLTEAARRPRLTLALYLLNLLAAALLAAPMAVLLDSVLGRSVVAADLVAQFRFEVLIDFLRGQQEALHQQYLLVGIGALVYAIASAVLSGGVIDGLKAPPRSPFLPRFLGGCGRYAFRFLRLLPYLAVGLALLYGCNLALDRLLLALFQRTPHAIAAFWVMRGKQLLLLLLLLLLAALFDLARILAALEDRVHMIGALLTAGGFLARHLGSILGLYLLLLLLGLALFVPYLLVAQAILPAASIAALVVLQQMVMLLRHWFRVTGYASLLAFYRGATGAAALQEDDGMVGSPQAAVPGALGPPVVTGAPGGTPLLSSRLLGVTALLLLLTPAAMPGATERGGGAAAPAGGAPAAAAAPHGGAATPVAAARAPASDRVRRVTAYRIEATLDPARRLVTGRETLTYRNLTSTPMRDLRMHLYPNAFSNTRTLYMRGAAWSDAEFQARLDRMRRDRVWGDMRLLSIRLADGTDLTSDTTIDETVMTVRLPAAVAPGEVLRVQVAWETLLPRTFHRMGAWGDHFDVTQWFPKAGVFTDAGWITHPFYRHAEFFADFGSYEVTLTVPDGWLVEATGVPGPARSNPDGTRSVTFAAEEVHDFAWLADRDARVARRVVADGPYQGAPVELLYVHQPDRDRMADRILDTVEAGLRYYGRQVMPYPYPRIVIDGLPAGLSGGMEYPMLFTIAMPALPSRLDLAPEEVTMHEFGHQYWYGLIATNEVEEPWLDEGIDTYVTRRAMDAAFGVGTPGRTVNAMFDYAAARILDEGLQADCGWVRLDLAQLLGFHNTPIRPVGGGLLGDRLSPYTLRLPGLDDGLFVESKDRYARASRDDAITTPSWGFHPGSYYDIVYDKTDVVLETMARLLGPGRLDEALRAYAVRHRFGHPTADDFFAALRETAARARPGLDLGPYIDQLFRGTATVDFAVESLRSRPLQPAVGLLPGTRVGEAPSDHSTAEDGGGEAPRYETEVIVRRLGDAVLPVDLRVRFENGEEAREHWDGAATWRRYTYETSSRAEEAEIDPDQIYAVDLDLTNNGLVLDRRPAPVARLALLWLFWLQNYLHLAGALS